MTNSVGGHSDIPNNPSQRAVNLTPDILRVLEETREGAMEELEKIGDYSNESLKIRNSPEDYGLESEDFRVDSTGWKENIAPDGTKYLVNPERDIWERTGQQFDREQLFTQAAAIRETRNAGKRLPTLDEWKTIALSINPELKDNGKWQKDISVAKALNIKLGGYRDYQSEGFSFYGLLGNFWSSSGDYHVGFDLDEITLQYSNGSMHGYQVRCLADSSAKPCISEEEYMKLKSSGLLWEIHDNATGNYEEDKYLIKSGKI